MSLPDGEKISKICLFVLTWSTNVTDRRTDTAWQQRPRLCIALRGKNRCLICRKWFTWPLSWPQICRPLKISKREKTRPEHSSTTMQNFTSMGSRSLPGHKKNTQQTSVVNHTAVWRITIHNKPPFYVCQLTGLSWRKTSEERNLNRGQAPQTDKIPIKTNNNNTAK